MIASRYRIVRLLATKRSRRYPGLLVLAFFSTVTAGILPIVFLGIARARRRRVRRFQREGTPTVAEILDIQPVKIAFDEHLSQVSYQFEAGGTMHRDTDLVLPMFANRWRCRRPRACALSAGARLRQHHRQHELISRNRRASADRCVLRGHVS